MEIDYHSAVFSVRLTMLKAWGPRTTLGPLYHGQTVSCSGVKDGSTRGGPDVTNSLGASPKVNTALATRVVFIS